LKQENSTIKEENNNLKQRISVQKEEIVGLNKENSAFKE